MLPRKRTRWWFETDQLLVLSLPAVNRPGRGCEAKGRPRAAAQCGSLGVSQCQEYGRYEISSRPLCILSARIAGMNSTETRRGSSETATPSLARHAGGSSPRATKKSSGGGRNRSQVTEGLATPEVARRIVRGDAPRINPPPNVAKSIGDPITQPSQSNPGNSPYSATKAIASRVHI